MYRKESPLQKAKISQKLDGMENSEQERTMEHFNHLICC
jgi:hypothetical protein